MRRFLQKKTGTEQEKLPRIIKYKRFHAMQKMKMTVANPKLFFTLPVILVDVQSGSTDVNQHNVLMLHGYSVQRL